MKTRKRSQMIKRYSKNFLDKVRADFPREIWPKGYPVIKCFRIYGIVTDYDGTLPDGVVRTPAGNARIAGFYNHKRKEIEIYGITREKPENLKETVRHECLHWLLDIAGLPFGDDSTIFLTLAIYYCAMPYQLIDYIDISEV